jgi:hypothetical protein
MPRINRILFGAVTVLALSAASGLAQQNPALNRLPLVPEWCKEGAA